VALSLLRNAPQESSKERKGKEKERKGKERKRKGKKMKS
jgi:hypothetical protein